MQMHTLLRHSLAVVAGFAILALFSALAAADPPSRVARLGYMAGAVSFSPAGENDWVQATLNRPLGTGDRLWAEDDGRARAEIQVGGAMIRMAAGTSLSVLNLDDRITQLQVTQGSLNVRVRRLDPNQVFEVDTPNLAFTLRQPGAYRIDVDPESNATTIVVRQGKGEAYGDNAAYVIDAQQPYRFIGTGLLDYQAISAPRPDDFDRWASSRDRRHDNSRSARYVSSDVVGYQDLDANGSWRVDAAYGNVWVPNHVAADWVPYSDGHWAWVDPWGWTWIDDAPWGFAVSHYGRWANLGDSWGWVPGPVRSRAYYAPALVAFVGGNNFQLGISSGNIGAVAWFPLAPREVYRPSYPASRRYFENINRSNTVINNTVINQQYNNTNVTNVVYANRQVAGAVVAIPTTAFVQSQPVARGEHRISREGIAGRPVTLAPPVAPTEKSVRGAAAPGDKPPARVFERPVVARTAVPAAHAGFAAQREQLSAKPGKPLDDASRKGLKPSAAAPVPVVKLIAPHAEGLQPVRPPSAAARTDERRGPSESRQNSTAPALPSAPPPDGPALAAKPPVPVAPVPEPRGRRESDERRGPPDSRRDAAVPVPPSAPPPDKAAAPAPKPREQPATEARRAATTPPPEKPSAPMPTARPERSPEAAGQPPESRGRGEPRNRNETPAPPVAQPKTAVPPEIAPRPAKAPEAPAREPRGNPEQRGSAEPRAPVVTPPPRPPEPKAPPPPAPPPPPPPQRAAPPPPPAQQVAPPAPTPQAAPAATEKPKERQRGRGDKEREDDKPRDK